MNRDTSPQPASGSSSSATERGGGSSCEPDFDPDATQPPLSQWAQRVMELNSDGAEGSAPSAHESPASSAPRRGALPTSGWDVVSEVRSLPSIDVGAAAPADGPARDAAASAAGDAGRFRAEVPESGQTGRFRAFAADSGVALRFSPTGDTSRLSGSNAAARASQLGDGEDWGNAPSTASLRLPTFGADPVQSATGAGRRGVAGPYDAGSVTSIVDAFAPAARAAAAAAGEVRGAGASAHGRRAPSFELDDASMMGPGRPSHEQSAPSASRGGVPGLSPTTSSERAVTPTAGAIRFTASPEVIWGIALAEDAPLGPQPAPLDDAALAALDCDPAAAADPPPAPIQIRTPRPTTTQTTIEHILFGTLPDDGSGASRRAPAMPPRPAAHNGGAAPSASLAATVGVAQPPPIPVRQAALSHSPVAVRASGERSGDVAAAAPGRTGARPTLGSVAVGTAASGAFDRSFKMTPPPGAAPADEVPTLRNSGAVVAVPRVRVRVPGAT